MHSEHREEILRDRDGGEPDGIAAGGFLAKHIGLDYPGNGMRSWTVDADDIKIAEDFDVVEEEVETAIREQDEVLELVYLSLEDLMEPEYMSPSFQYLIDNKFDGLYID